MSEKVKVFITYAREDVSKKDELIKRLGVMKRNGLISLWHDKELIAGDEWEADLLENLLDSDFLLHLTSASSLDSNYCNKELTLALTKNIKPIPVILEACDWQNDRLNKFQVLPDDGTPINEWNPESKGWQNVVDGIRKAIHKMQRQKNPSSNTTPTPDSVSPDPNTANSIDLDSAIQRGNTLMMFGQIDTALTVYSQVIHLDPDNAIAYYNRGRAYRVKNQYAKAIADYTQAIRLKQDFASAYLNRGVVYRLSNEYTAAMTDFNTAIELEYGYAEAYNNRGLVYDTLQEYDKAIADFNEAIKLKPQEDYVYINRGNVYALSGRYSEAIADLKEATRLNPENASAYYSLGNTYTGLGKYDEAIIEYTKAIELDPNYNEAYNNRGNAYLQLRRPDLALEDFNKAIELDPNNIAAIQNRTLAQMSLDLLQLTT